VSPAGTGVDALWRLILEARSAEDLMPEYDKFEMNTRIFGPLREFDPLAAGLEPEVVERNDRYAQFALVAAQEAIGQARLLDGPLDRERVGVNIGTAIAGTSAMEQGFLAATNGGKDPVSPSRARPNLYQYMCPSTATVEVAARYGFQGPSVTTSTGCTAGIDSVGYAFHAIHYGDADVFVAGGSDAPLVPISIAAFDAIHAVTRKPPDRVGHGSAPFSAERDGFVLAEGCGIVVLEELRHAEQRGATILAEVASYASTSNAFHMTGLPANGVDLARAINLSLAAADIRPGEVNYLNAHGSSTPQNDRGESAAYRLSFGRRAEGIPVSSLKSQLGHALGAASSIEIISSVLAIQNDYLPPTLNYQTPSEDCDLGDYVPNHGRPHPVDVVLTDASGFSGLHASMVIRGVHD
jgi:3-oxoacyl-(acyl-carrier-protein) synthase